MKRLIYWSCLLLPLFLVGCRNKSFEGPSRRLVILNDSDDRLLITAEIAAEDKDIAEKRMISHENASIDLPATVCNVFVFGPADTVQSMIFEYDFSKLDSTQTLYWDATGVTPYAIVDAAYLYDHTDYIVKPLKYDATNVATDADLKIEWHEAGEPFLTSQNFHVPGEMEKELSSDHDLRMLIPMPAKQMTLEEKVAYIDKFLKDLGTKY